MRPAGAEAQAIGPESGPGETPAAASAPGRPLAGLLILLAATGWGTAGVVLQLLTRPAAAGAGGAVLSPMTVAYYRLLLAAPLLVLVALARPRVHGRQLFTRPLLVVALGAGLGGYQLLYFLAITQIGVAVSTMLALGLAPVVAVCWESARSRAMPRRRVVVAVVTAVLGLSLVAFGTRQGGDAGAGPDAGGLWWGLAAASAAGLIYGLCTVGGTRAGRTVGPVALTAATTSIGALVLLPPAALAGLTVPNTGAQWAGLAYLGVAATGLAYLAFYRGLQHTGSSVAAVLTLWEPVAAALLAWCVLGERLAVPALIGSALVLAAIAMLGRSRR